MKKMMVVILVIVGGLLLSDDSSKINEAIRVRIIANSNSEFDQNLKYEVKNNIVDELTKILQKKESVEEVRIALNNNLSTIDEEVNRTLNGIYSYNINYGINYFPAKENYPSGEYESLVITLGSGMGDNWWCILFPPLCLLEAEEETSEEIEYEFLFPKFINNIFNLS